MERIWYMQMGKEHVNVQWLSWSPMWLCCTWISTLSFQMGLYTTAWPNTPNNPKENAGFNPSWTEYYKTSATLCLAQKLANANATLCFAGDSIDFQIYYTMQNNLKSVSQLQAMHHAGNPDLVNVMDREIRVTHSTEPGTMDDWYLTGHHPPDGNKSFVTGDRPPPGSFGSMYSILEMKEWFEDGRLSRKLARI